MPDKNNIHTISKVSNISSASIYLRKTNLQSIYNVGRKITICEPCLLIYILIGIRKKERRRTGSKFLLVTCHRQQLLANLFIIRCCKLLFLICKDNSESFPLIARSTVSKCPFVHQRQVRSYDSSRRWYIGSYFSTQGLSPGVIRRKWSRKVYQFGYKKNK